MSYKIVTLQKPKHLFYPSVQLDTSRITAILIRQSRRGSDKAHIESRMLQESLIPFVMAAREEDDLVLARPDRLFRDKHFSNVSTFTELAEKKRVKVIIPQERGVLVYDFTRYEDLKEFQRAMQEAYAYIDTQIGYMVRARKLKVSKGYYGGGNISLPFVLLRDMPKEMQTVVVYEPWREQAKELFTKFKEFNFQTGRLARYIEDKPCLFPFMEEDNAGKYMVVTTMTKNHQGYTIAYMESLRRYLKNLSLAGFTSTGKDEDNNIILVPDIIEQVVPLELFDPCFASLTGQHIDGTPYNRGRIYRGGANENIDALLHGLLTSDDGSINVFANSEDGYPKYDLRNYNKDGMGITEVLWSIPARPIDRIVLNRLIALAEFDNGLVHRVREFFAQAQKTGANSLEVLDTAIRNTQEAIQRVGRTIVKLTKGLVDDKGNPIELAEDDPNIVEQRKLYMQLRKDCKSNERMQQDRGRKTRHTPYPTFTMCWAI